ncbi:hypothetical protein ACSL103130_10855 [Actinomyces slackii]
MIVATMRTWMSAATARAMEASASAGPMMASRTMPTMVAGAAAMPRRRCVVVTRRPSRLGRWRRIRGTTTAQAATWLSVLATAAQVIQWLAGATT